AGVDEAGEGNQASQEIVELLVAGHRMRKRLAGIGGLGKRREPAFEILLEGPAILIGAIEIALHLRIVDAGIEGVEVPFGQRAETAGRRKRGGAAGHGLCWCGHGTNRSMIQSGMTFFESSSRSSLLLAHDLFRKPVSTPDQVRGRLFRDHALSHYI